MGAKEEGQTEILERFQSIVTCGLEILQKAKALEKPPSIEEMETGDIIKHRLKRCQTAADIFAEFSVDAAALKVTEMYKASTSGDRQRAQDRVLNYALGKPVERSMSIQVRVANMTDDEIDHETTRLLEKFAPKLGFKGGTGTSRSILIANGGEGRPPETGELQTQSGLPDEIHPEPRLSETPDSG
jgi:hypothetical protein